MRKLTQEEIVARFREIHGDRYDYSKVQYVNTRTNVTIICRQHGEFVQNPRSHLKGCGCPKCYPKTLPMDNSTFISKAILVHGNKYDYSKVEYINNHTKVCIICPEHGEFWQTPNNHLNGQNCPICSNKINPNIPLTCEEFISKAKEIHPEYDYSQTKYINVRSNILVICPEHGIFKQIAGNHLGGQGCPKCSKSKGEKLIEGILQHMNIKIIPQYSIKSPINIRKSGRIFVDFYLPDYNMIIEYNGKQHYVPIKKFGGNIAYQEQVKRDKYLRDYCTNNNIELIEIKYDQNKDVIESILKNKLKNEHIV